MTRSRNRAVKSRRGFTLIESMATIVILGTLGSVASFLILNSIEGYSDSAIAAQLHAELSIALDRATRELRKIELDDGAGQVAPKVTSVSPTSIVWQDAGDDQYELTLSGGTVVIQENGTGQAVLVSDVTAFAVSTFDEDNVALAANLTPPATEDIRRVQLDLTVARSGATETLQTKVFLRSTMSGAQGGP